ncbi:MAG: metallophosphoesterase [Elainellaceae cyanobacterium]
MRVWRSALRLVLRLVLRLTFRFWFGSLLGLCLALLLYACQTVAISEANAPEANREPITTPAEILSAPPASSVLPPETAAIVASAPGGQLYNPPRGDVRLVVISDLNAAYGSTDYDPEVDQGIQLLPFWQPDLVLCGGDMVAGQDPSLTVEEIRAMWAAFDQHVAAPLRAAALPFGFTIGNHDASGARSSDGSFLFQQERTLAADYWNAASHNPGVQFVDRTDFPFYYSFEQSGIFFLVWDGSTSAIPPDKLTWVEQTLASDRAQQARLRVLIGHLPLYGVAVGRDEPYEVMENADQLRQMLERYNVHTYISGHQHAYYPAHRGKLQLLHSGILGSGPRPLIDSDRPPQKTLTVIDVKFSSPELTTYTTYDMRSLEVIELQELPRFLVAHNGIILRRDVQGDALNASEKAFCEQRLGATGCTP